MEEDCSNPERSSFLDYFIFDDNGYFNPLYLAKRTFTEPTEMGDSTQRGSRFLSSETHNCKDSSVDLNTSPATVIIENLMVLYLDRKSTRLNSSHIPLSRMPSSA